MQGISVARQCSLLYGVTAFIADAYAYLQGPITYGIEAAIERGLAPRGGYAVVVTRVQGTLSGATVKLIPFGDHELHRVGM
jgi:hypothetical protein